jgi:hypothetical protein
MYRVGLSTWQDTGAGRQTCNLQLRPRRADRVHAFHNAAVTKQLLAARCNVDLQTNHGATALQVAERKGQEDADRAMKEHLEEEDKDAAAAAAVSQKKKQAKKVGKSVGKDRRDAADGQHGSQKEEHAEGQKDTERTEETAVPEKKTANVAAVAVASALKDKVEVRGGKEEEGCKQEAAERKEAEGAGTSEEIQVCGLFQEKDDDDGLPDESPAKRKSKSKTNRAGGQGSTASKTAP